MTSEEYTHPQDTQSEGNLETSGADQRSEQFWRTAAEPGDRDAQYNIAALLDEQGRVDGAASWYQRAASSGDIDA
jgi:TPR repeat protein